MLAGLAHRGPCGIGIHTDVHASLGAARLAIRGIADGRQPILDEETGVIAVCNGEIDNHRDLRRWLETQGQTTPAATDVAVIPGLYLVLGEDFAERLHGAFALAVWDPRCNRLILARDRAGERPLYYRGDSGIVRFASEIGALTRGGDDRLDPDGEAMAHYLRFGVLPGDRSPYRGIRQVRPAETVTFDAAGCRRRRYWRWPLGDVAKKPPQVADFEKVFSEAVRRQSDVDVEFGVFLSGGVNSALVAAVAKRVRPEKPPLAFTLRFDVDSFDESSWAKRVAGELGLPIVETLVRAEDFPDALSDMIGHCGQPLGDPAWLPTAFLARRACKDVRIALVGEGADEIFGGYPTYLGARIAAAYARLPGPARALIRWGAETWPVSDRKVALSYLAKRFVAAQDLDGLARHVEWVSVIPPRTLRRLGIETVEAVPPRQRGEILDMVQRFDFETSLADGLLTKSDRAGMRWAVETRAPFLDAAVLEFAATLPSDERVRGLRTKSFLKRFAERHLPRNVVHRRKRGLSVPLAVWLRGPLRAWALEKLASPRLGGLGIDQEVVMGLFDEHLGREQDHARVLWVMIVLSEWLDWDAGREGARFDAAAAQPAATADRAAHQGL